MISEKITLAFCDKNSPYFGAQGLLSMILKASKGSLSEEQTHALADMAAKKISELPIKDKNIYNGYFFLLSRYAGKNSMPLFRAYFENEYRAFNLIAVANYFKKHLDKGELKSMMQRKAILLKQSQDEIDKFIGLKEK
jgi:hypothetical protein